jgi:hypothetical protein
VSFIFVSEIADCCEYGVGSSLTEAAKCAVFNCFAKLFKKFDIAFFTFTVNDSGNPYQNR